VIKLIAALFFFCSLPAFSAETSILLSHKYEDLFPAGVPGNDWFSKRAFGGNQIRILRTGQEVLAERLKLIESARQSILLSTYIYDTDQTANQITEALCKRAMEGVDIRMLLDSMGSKKFFKKESERLRRCGIGIMLFAPGKWDLLRVVKTMHEKLLIIDGYTISMGGNGVQNSYHHIEPAHKFFHDMEMVMQGPVACWWHFRFIDTYHKSRIQDRPKEAMGDTTAAIRLDEHLYGARRYPVCYPFNAGNSRVVPVYGNPFFDGKKTPIEDTYLTALENLEEGATVKLYGPYFVPTKRFVKALLKARSEKHAKISIITNSVESNDEGWAPLVGMVFSVSKLLDAGVDIRLWPGPMTLHRKVGIYNGKWAYVGSDNLDSRAQHFNTETVTFTDDRQIVKELETEFDQDYAKTKPLTKNYFKTILDKRSPFQRWFVKKILKFL